MVAYAPPSSRPSKVAPRRHWTTMQGLLAHSRQLHHVLKAVEREDERYLRLRSPRATVSAPRAVAPQAKPLVFRKTKREIQREQELAAKQSKQNEADDALVRMHPGSNAILRQLDNLRSTLLASCQRLSSARASHRPSCRTQYLRRSTSAAIGLNRRCPPRRRLLF